MASRALGRRVLVTAVSALGMALVATTGAGPAGAASGAPRPLGAFPAWRAITFPVHEPVDYIDSFGACRNGCTRSHQGQDLIGRQLYHELAAVDGTITYLRQDAAGTGGNWLVLTDSQGWTYQYGHINNDTPGTDDDANPARWRFAPGIKVGSKVKAGQFIAYMGESGDTTVPHLHFEIRTPQGVAINEWASLRLAQGKPISADWCRVPTNAPQPPQSSASADGYWVVGRDGRVAANGGVQDYGDASALGLWAPVLGVTPTPNGKGYWLTARDGGIFSYGNARFYGSTGGMTLVAPVAGMVATSGGKGYWLFAEDGGIFSFGDARFYGSAAGKLDAGTRVTAVARTPSGAGYWILASNGKVFAFGDAAKVASAVKFGSTARSIASTPTGQGYWIVSALGNVVAVGDAKVSGTPAASGLCQRTPAAVVGSATGKGYYTLLVDGTVLTFGDAKWYGDPRGTIDAVGMATFAS